ncbi:hypothetical protein SUGI_0793090 [Cryptomeria japonica]|nr:hypothetical protein SUGI_0793090 [Cryptomeria japonica]
MLRRWRAICLQVHIYPLRSSCRPLFTVAQEVTKREDPYTLMKEDGIQKVYADETGMPCAKNAIHWNALENLLSLRNAVLESKFMWDSRTDFYIRSPKDKTRLEQQLSKTKLRQLMTSAQPSPFQDRIVQEVLLMILEPIFEPRFSQKSYAFRPGRNAHTVLRVIRSKFGGYAWFLKGDLSTIFDGLETKIVMGCLSRVVKDKNVNGLIRSALMKPVMNTSSDERKKKKKKKKGKFPRKRYLAEDEPKPDPHWLETFFGFAPEEAAKVPSWGHCGVLSPLLMNICLNELDQWMEERIAEFYRPSSSDVIWKDSIDAGSYNPAWPEFVPTSSREKTRKMDYIRYGGHILIGVRGPRRGANYIRKKIIEFCEEKYGLNLDKDGFPIEHISRGIVFLDHLICRRVIYPTLRYTGTGGEIVSKKGVGTLLSVTASLEQCICQFRKLRFVKGDRDPDPQPCYRMIHATQGHNNSQMNKFLETMAEWYRYADNRKKVTRFCSYIVRGSLAKLYAAKYKLRSRAKVYKIASRNLSRPLKRREGHVPDYNDLLRMGLVDAISGIEFSNSALIPTTDYTPFSTNWIPDHEKVLHEYINVLTPKTFREQRALLKQKGLVTPQEYMSIMVWNFKMYGVFVDGVPISENQFKQQGESKAIILKQQKGYIFVGDCTTHQALQLRGLYFRVGGNRGGA